MKKFQDFILRANKYPTLSIFAGNNDEARQKIILVEVSVLFFSLHTVIMIFFLPTSVYLNLHVLRVPVHLQMILFGNYLYRQEEHC